MLNFIFEMAESILEQNNEIIEEYVVVLEFEMYNKWVGCDNSKIEI